MPRVCGIDLGTTNSLIAIVEGGRPRVLRDGEGRAIVPSLVAAAKDGELRAGEPARALLESRPGEVIYSVKRLMGRDIEDVRELLPRLPYRVMGEPGDTLRVKCGYQWLTPPQVSAEILRALRKQAQDALGALVTQAVVTVPAYFNDAQRQATKDAGKLAGLDVLRIVNEPTAACLAYGLHERREGHIAVYDLGGGTFDISILRLQGGIFEVLATNGDTQLGGDDIDRMLGDELLRRLALAGHEPTQVNASLVQRLRLAAERLKIALTDAEAAEATIDIDGTARTVSMTRADFEALLRPTIARTLEPCRQALEDADLVQEDIDEVVLVGGSTRTPLVRRMIGEYFGRTPHTELDPEQVVALGAAVQADILGGGTRDVLLLDVTPLSLGIESYGGTMQRIIPRNTTVPASATELFTTFVDSQTHVDVHILQGERDLASGNRSLARFRLGPLVPLPAGMHRIEVTFTLDADGILSVRARDQRTGTEHAITVKPTYGLGADDVDAMLKAAEDAAKSDGATRALIEERTHAELTLRATRKGLAEAGDVIDEIDAIVIEEQLGALERAIGGDDLLSLRAARDRVEGAAQPLAVAMMNAALLRGLKGRRAEEVLGAAAPESLSPAQVNPTHIAETKVTFGGSGK